jgi:hypothetical protein
MYFLEGLIAGIASPSSELAKSLFHRMAKEHDLIPAEFEAVRGEIDVYLDAAETEVENHFQVMLATGRVRG